VSDDPELARLLLDELKRHLVPLEADPPDIEAVRRAFHALKGSAGLAGERELSSALDRIHRRLRDGDERAREDGAETVRTAIRRMSAGESAVVAHWPEPPIDLDTRPIEAGVRAQYAAEVADRLARIDEALAVHADANEELQTIYRQIHTVKGAASAVGEEAMSWFCHGLEERIRAAQTGGSAATMLQEVTRWRPFLGALLDDPETALRTLRTLTRSQPPQNLRRPSARPLESDPPRSGGRAGDEPTIRVSAAAIDRLLDQFEAIDLARDRVAARADGAREVSRSTRRMRAKLLEALRLIGPPRPWGAPAAALRRIEEVVAALGPIGEDAEQASGGLRGVGIAIRESVAQAKKQISTMRQTPVGWIFARLATAIEAEARRSDRSVIVRTRGADEPIDRRIAEALVEPCLQLVRNAVAHGIETPDERTAAGKGGSGTISLVARRTAHRLSLTIEDDGAGVDVAEVRRRAVEAGALATEIAEGADDDTLLALLFLPGFSTRDSTDLLAGRGIGLDIARSSIQRMGGSIRISSRVREGFSARIDVPIESGLAQVLWVSANGEEYAVPVLGRVSVAQVDPGETTYVPHLSTCLAGRGAERAVFSVTFDLDDERDPAPITFGVDSVGRVEELLVRQLPPLVVGLGPFAGAVARGDGSLRLALDLHAMAPRARALARGARGSDAPSSRRIG
jgi:chemotaxis protein histidine kinase CheA